MPNGDELDTLISSLPAAGAPPPAAPKTSKSRTSDPLSAIRERNPDFAKVAEDFQSFARARGVPDAYIKSGYRTAKQQNDIFNGPRGRLTKGNDGYIKLSPHQEARAIDWSTRDPNNRAALHRLISVFAQKHKLHVPVDEPWHMSGAPAKKNGNTVLAPTDSDPLDAVLRDIPAASPSEIPVPEPASQPESLADSATPTSALTPAVSQTPAPSRYQMSPVGLQQPTPSPTVGLPEDSHYTPPKPPEGAMPNTELSGAPGYDVPLKPFDVERVGALGAIGNAGSEAQQVYLDFVRRNAQPVKGKPVNIDQAAADETMARTFMQIQTLFKDQPNASPTDTTKAIAQMGIDFLRDPATKGQVMPRALHEAMLSAQWTPEETKTLPGKLRTQIQQRDVKHRIPQVQRGAQTTPIAIFRGDGTNNPYFTIQGVSTYFNSPDEMKAALDHLGVQIDWRGPFGGLIHANIPGRVVRQAPRSVDQDALKKEQASQFIQNAIYGTPQMGDAERERLTQAEEAKGQKGEEAIKAAIGFSPEMNLLPADLQNWIGGLIAKGGAGLAEYTAGIVRNAPRDPFGRDTIVKPTADKINSIAEEINSGALNMDRKARRSGLSQTALDVLGGSISSAPALALTALGVPAPVSFGLQSYLSASGRDAELSELLLETGKGATIGALFELPVPAKLELLTKIGSKLGPLGESAGTAVERGTLVGGGTYGLERATGASHQDALKSAIVNALFASSNEAMKIARAGGEKVVEQVRKLGGRDAGTIRSDQAQPIQAAPELQRQGVEGARGGDFHREGEVRQPVEPGEVAPQRQPAPSDVVSKEPEGQVPVQSQPEIVEPIVTPGLQSKEQANEPIPSTAKAQPVVKPGIAKAQAEAKAERAPEIRETTGPALPRVAGADTDISIPGTSRKYKARYVLREADDLQASHNPENFQPNLKYPYQNDRRYESEKQYQTQVIQRSSSTGPEPFDPRHLVNNSPTSDTGPPAITEDGQALGGNSRVMIAKRVYANNPEGAAAYKTWLKENAASFGLDPAQVDGMKQPILAREISNEGLRSNSDIQEAITQLNVTATTPLTREEQGVSGANRMTPEGMDFIAQKIESMGEDATLAKAMDKHGVDIVNRLISDGVVAPGDRNVLIKDGKPTPEAKTRVERLLTGRVYRDIGQMEATSPGVKNNIERVVPYLTQTEGTDWDLIPTVRRSLNAIAESKASKIPVNELNAQASMTRGENYSPEEVAVAQTLLKGSRQAAKVFRSYASDYQNEVSGQEGLFGPAKTQAQSFDEKFGTGGDELDRVVEGVAPQKEDVANGRQTAEIQNLPPAESAKAAEVVSAPPAAASGERSDVQPSSAELTTTRRPDTGIEPAKPSKENRPTDVNKTSPAFQEWWESQGPRGRDAISVFLETGSEGKALAAWKEAASGSNLGDKQIKTIVHNLAEEANKRLSSEAGAVNFGDIYAVTSNLIQRARDQIAVDPIPGLKRVGVAGEARMHAAARIAVPHIVKDFLAKVFPEQYTNPEAMAVTIDIINKDNILGGYDEFLRKAREASAAQDEGMAQYWQNRADDVGDAQDIETLAKEVEAAKNDPQIMANIERWNQFVNPELDQLYNEMKRLDPDTPREGRGRVFGARVNLLPEARAAEMKAFADPDRPMPEGVSSNYRNPNVKKDRFMRQAKFTGQYSTDAAAVLTNVVGPRWNEVTKLRFYDALTGSGVAVELDYGETPPAEIQGQKAVRMPIKVPETGEGGLTRMVEKTLYVRSDIAREARDVLNTDMPLPNNRMARLLTTIQLAQLTDMTAHLKNIHTVLAATPATKSAWTDAVRRLPVLGTVDTVARITKVTREVLADTPAIRDEIAEMAKLGLIRPEYPLTGLQKITRGQQLIHHVDTAARITMNRFFDNMVEAGRVKDTLENRASFVQQIGEYNRRLMGPLMRAAKDSGFAPFIVAGRSFNRQARRMLTGHPGVEASTLAESAKMRAVNITSGLVAATVLPSLLNVLTTGNLMGRPGTPIGAWDLGKPEDETDKHRVIDLMQIIGIRRGLRATGAGAVIEGLREGQTWDEIAGKATSDVLTTAAHPWMGPALGFGYQTITGKRLDLRGGPEAPEAYNVGGGGKQYLENARTALENQNPLLYSAVSPLVEPVPSDESYPERLLKGVTKGPSSAFGVYDMQSPAQKILSEDRRRRGAFSKTIDQAKARELRNQLREKEARGENISADLDKAVADNVFSLRQVHDFRANADLSPLALQIKYAPLNESTIRAFERMDERQKNETKVVMALKLQNANPEFFTPEIRVRLEKDGFTIPEKIGSHRKVSDARRESQQERREKKAVRRFLPPESRPTPNPNRRYQVTPR